MVDEGVDGLRELLMEPRCGRGGWFPIGIPFLIEGFDGVREDGNEESEPWRPMLLVVPVVPLVEGRYESTEAIVAISSQVEE